MNTPECRNKNNDMADTDRNAGAIERKAVKPVINFWLFVALLAVSVLLANAAVFLLGERFPLAVDITAGKVYRLENETVNFIRGLEDDITIYILADKDEFLAENYLIQAQRIISQFPRYSRRVAVRYVDYAGNPAFASQFPGLPLEHGNILVSGRGNVRKILISELFNFTYLDAGGNVAVSSSRAEEALTSAILYVTSDDRSRVAVLTGNGAADMPALSRVLSDNNYDVAALDLASSGLGDEYDFAILLAPKSDYSVNEMSKIDGFLYNGGKYGKTLIYTADPSQPRLPNIDAFLAEWGLAFGDGAVFETDPSRTYLNRPFYVMPEYTDAGFRDMLADSKSNILLPMSRPLNVLFRSKDDNYTGVLLEFGGTAGVRPTDAPEGFTASQAAVWGPMPAMARAEKRLVVNGETKSVSNVVASASTQMFETTVFYSTVLTNGEYVINIMNSLANRKNAVNVRPKSMGGYAFGISTEQSAIIGVILFAVIPLLIIGTGVFIWLKRRFS